MVRRQEPSPYVADEDGQVRVVQSMPGVGDLVRLATEEISFYGRESIQVPARLHAMLDDLLTCTLDRYRSTLETIRDDVLPPRRDLLAQKAAT